MTLGGEEGLSEPVFEENSGGMLVTLFAQQTKVETGVKTRVKTGEKILQIIKENPKITIPEISKSTGLTIKGMEWNIKDLKKKELLKRIGSTKGKVLLLV